MLKPNIRTVLSLIPILILCTIIFHFNSAITRCYGMGNAALMILLLALLFVLLLIFLTRQIYKIARRSQNHRSRFWLSLVAIMSTIISLEGGAAWKKFQLGTPILSASVYPIQNDIGRIELIRANKYYAQYGHIDWSCSFRGDYKILNDTLALGGNPYEKSGGILANSYILTDSTLVPIARKNQERMQIKVLKIVK